MTQFSAVSEILRAAILERAFPGAAIELGRRDGILWREVFGTLTYDPETPDATPGTIYDLASLTKVIATTTLVMRAVDRGWLRLDDAVSRWLPAWRGTDREPATVRDLLAHSSGLTGYLPLFRDHTGRQEFEHTICTLPLEYAPGSRSLYSDLGFILLGFILEDAHPRPSGSAVARSASDPATWLATQFQQVASALTSDPLTYNLARPLRRQTAPTEVDPWRGRLLVGEVHDENTWALGGVAGHAGLFGTIGATGAFARAVLRTLGGEPVLARPDTLREFLARTDAPGSSRALGWDTMLPTSSCGTRLSASSIGHTGFTGTSIWIDWERDLYIALLTNRVYPTRENDRIQRVRPAVHDAVIAALER